MNLLIRPPGDDFTFRLFYRLAGKIVCEKDMLYLWSPIMDPTPRQKKVVQVIHPMDRFVSWEDEHEFLYRPLIEENIKSDVIVIGVKDHLTPLHFNPWTDKQPIISWYLEGLFEYYPNKKFIFFTSVENVDPYISAPNVKIIPWGGDITNHQRQYSSVEPILDKNLDSPHTFVSLNRNQRHHRCMLISLLYGLELDKHGIISCLFKEKFIDLFRYSNWKFTADQQNIKDILTIGFDNFKNSEPMVTDDWEIYTNNNNDNVSNFKNKLSNYYRNTFVEIVTETSYTEKCFNLTEKTLNSVYGCNFPIILSSKGAVEFLRNMGLDTFDDIIDHSYDDIENPIDRLYRAITDNIELLTNNENTKQLWINNKDRFIKNVDFVKNRMYNFYSSRAEQLFLEAKNEFNL